MSIGSKLSKSQKDPHSQGVQQIPGLMVEEQQSLPPDPKTKKAPLGQPPKATTDPNMVMSELRKKLGKSQHEIEDLKNQLAERRMRAPVEISPIGKEMKFRYQHPTDRKFSNTVGESFAEDTKYLAEILRPLIIMTMAIARGQDLHKRNRREKLGPDGKRLSGQYEKDANGRVVLMPSVMDRVRDLYNGMVSDPEVVKSLKELNDRLTEITPVSKTVTTPSSSLREEESAEISI